MSHPHYNPFASGSQCSNQGQYGNNTVQPERDPRRTSSRLVLGSGFNTSGGSSSASTNPPGKIPALMAQQVSYRPDESTALVDDDIQRSIDFHISRAREEVMFHDKPTHQSINQGNRFVSPRRDEFLPSSTGRTNLPMSSTSSTLQQRQSDTESASSSMDWLSSYKKPTTEDSSKYFLPSASSSYVNNRDSRFNPSMERDSNTQSIPGIGDFDYPGRPVTTEPGRPKYTSESAANILLHFGLEKEDLEHLILYPEDQITPANLPFILRQIRIQKTKRTPTASQSKPHSEPQPSRSLAEMDSMSSASMAVRRQEEISSAVLQASKVIDYGHTGKYTVGTGEEIGIPTGNRSNSSGSGNILMDAYDSSQNKPTGVRSSTLDSSREQQSSVTTLLSSYKTEPGTRELSSLLPQSNDPTKRLQDQQTKQPSQLIQSSFSLPKKDTDTRVHKTEVSKTLPSKDSNVGSQASSKTSASNTLFRNVHPSRPGLVVIGSREPTLTKVQSKPTLQGSITAEQIKKQQQQPLPVPAVLWPPVFSSAKPPVHPVSLNTTGLSASRATMRSVFVPGAPCPAAIPSTPPQGIPPLLSRPPMIHPSRQPPAAAAAAVAVAVSKGLPSPVMMHDYAAASPKIFPHTCSLCNKECRTTKDWISHQNTSLHLESCKVLRAKYPEWEGEIVLGPSAAGKDANPVPTASISQHRHQKTRRGRSSHSRSRSRSRSRSFSPRRHHDSRRDQRSRSRSPRSSRYSRRSRSHSPRYDRQTSVRYRSRSRSYERRSSPRRRDEKRSSPRSEDRRSPPRSRDRRSPHRRSDARRSSPRRSRERRSSSERASPQHTRSSSAERLAKKLLETTAAQSLSKPSELEAVVKSLAPALLAELAKMRSSATSSLTPKGEKSSRAPLTPKDKSSSSTASSTTLARTNKKKDSTTLPKTKASLQKTEASASSKAKLAKPSPPTMVKLQGIRSSLSHRDVVASVEQFGKTKSVVLFRSKLEAIVCFEKEEDAKKLKSIPMFDMKGMLVTVVTESNKQNVTLEKNPPTNPASASVSTHQATKATATKATATKATASATKPKCKKPVVVTHGKTQLTKSSTLSVGTKKTTTGNISKEKGLVKSSSNVSKAKALLSKAKGVSSEQKAKVDKPETGKTLAKNDTNGKAKGSTAMDTKVTPNKASKNQKGTKATSSETAENQKDIEVTSSKTAENQETKAASNETAENQKEIEPSKVEESKTNVKEDESVLVPDNPTVVVKTEDVVVHDSVPQAHSLNVDVKVREEKAEPMEVKTAETSSDVAEPMDIETGGENKGGKDLPPKCGESIVETTPDAFQLEQPSVSSKNTDASPDPADTLVGASLVIQESISTQPESTAEGLEAKTNDSKRHEGSSPEATLESELTVEELETKTLQKDHVTAVKNESGYASSKDASSAVNNVSAASTEDATPVQAKSTAALQSDQQATATTASPAAVEGKKQATATTASPAAVEGKKQATATTASPAAVEGKKQTATTVSSSPAPASVTIPEMVNLHERSLICLKRETCFKKKFASMGFNVLLISQLPKYEGCYTEKDIANLLIPSGFIHNDDTLYVIPQACMAFAWMPSSVNAQHVIKRCSSLSLITLIKWKVKVNVVAGKVDMTRYGFYKFVMNKMKMQVGDGENLIYIKNISASEARDLKENLKKIDGVINYFPLLNKVYIEFETIFDADRLGVWYNLLKQAPNHQIHRVIVPQLCVGLQPPKLATNAVPDSEHVVTVVTTKSNIPQATFAPLWVTLTSSPFVFPTSSPWFKIPDFATVRSAEDIQKFMNQGAKIHTVMLTGLPEGHYSHEDVARLVWHYFPTQNIIDLYYNVIVLPLQKRAFVHFNNWQTCCDFVLEYFYRPVVRGTKLKVHFVLEDMNLESKEELVYANLMKWSNARVPDVDSLEERLLCVEISEISVGVIKLLLELVSSIAPFVSYLPLANRICVEMASSSGVTQVLRNYANFTPNSFQQNFVWKNIVRFECLKSLKQRLEDSSEIRINLCANTICVKDKAPAVTSHKEPSPPKPSHSGSAVQESVTAALSASATMKCEEAPQTTPAAPAKGATANLPLIDDNTFKIITAAVREHRLTRETTTPSSDKESKSNKSSQSLKTKPEKKCQDDFTDDDVLSHAYIFNELSFNMEDFVTVDEVGDDIDTSLDQHSSSSREMSEGQSISNQISAKPSKDCKGSSSSSPPLFKTDKGSMKSDPSSVSTSASKDSCGATTKSSVSNASVSSPQSAETPSLGQKQQGKAPGEISAEIAEASVEAASHSEKEQTTEATETQSDHSVSPKDSAAKTVESEAKIELLPEMHLPTHPQSLQKDDIMKEEKKEESIDKCAKEEVDDGENYQILDSLDEQIDDENHEGKLASCLPESEEGQSPIEEVFQVLDSVDDEIKVCPQTGSEMEMEPSFKVLDSITEEQAATSQEETARIKTLSEEDVIQVLGISDDKCSTEDTSSICQHLSGKVDAEENQQTEEIQSKMLSGQTSNDLNDGHIHNEDQSLENRLTDVNEQETFEVLDSIDDQQEIEADGKKLETPSDMMPKEDIQPVTTKTDLETDKETRLKKGQTITRKDNRQAKRSSTRSRTPKSDDARTRQDKTAGASITADEITEEIVFEIVDSVDDEPVQNADTTERSGRRRSARGKKEDGSKDTPYKIVDSVDDETGIDETGVTTRSTRGRREKTVNDLSSDKSKTEETPTRRRHTPARDSQEKAASSPTKKHENVQEASEEAATYEVIDSVEEEIVKSDQSTTKGKRKRGRPRKDTVTSKKTNKDSSDKMAEEVTYQIVDSVEDEVVDDEPPKCSKSEKMENVSEIDDQLTKITSCSEPPKTEDEEEEPMYEIVDSLEEDQVQEEPVTTVVEATRHDNLANTGEDVQTPDNKGQESDHTCDTLATTSNLVKLDEVSEDEEDFPDDTAEKEELRRRQAAIKTKHLANEQKKGQEERKTRAQEERERRSRSIRGDTDGEAARKEKGTTEEEELEVDPKELVTLDEVGADEGGEDASQDGPEWDGDIPEAELQALVTLDEIVEDEEGKVEQTSTEVHPENLNPETLETLVQEKVDENQVETSSAKCKHEDTEENINYVTVDEVGENDEAAEKEAPTTRSRGRPRKRARQTPVRKSIRGRNVNANNEGQEENKSPGSVAPPPTSLDSSSLLDKDLSTLSHSQMESIDTSAEPNQSQDECVEQGEEEKEGWSRANVKVASKRKKELVGPEAKRSRSQSPCVAADFRLPPFNPSNPLGQEFVIPKSGYYCNICSVFYLNESSAKDLHCSSQRHYDNLQNYYQKLQQKPSSSTPNSQGFISE